MNEQLLLQKENFYEWIFIIVILAIAINAYGNQLLEQEKLNQNLKEKNQQHFTKVITLLTLIFIYITEKIVTDVYERRLINSIAIFASTFCYLYFLAKQENITKQLTIFKYQNKKKQI